MAESTKGYFNLDLDGVFADFDMTFKRRFGFWPTDFENKYGRQEFWKCVSNSKNYFKELVPMPYASSLFEFITTNFKDQYNFRILTACPRVSTYPTAAAEKEEWVRKHLCSEIEFCTGPYSRDKQKWVTVRENGPADILLDDRASNISEWRAAGGIGVLHMSRDPQKTFDFLSKML